MARILMTADQLKQTQGQPATTGKARVLMTADQLKGKAPITVKKPEAPKQNILQKADEAINKPAFTVADDGKKGGFWKNILPTIGKSIANTAKDVGANAYGVVKAPVVAAKNITYDIPKAVFSKQDMGTYATPGTKTGVGGQYPLASKGMFHALASDPTIGLDAATKVILPPAVQELAGVNNNWKPQPKKALESLAEKPVSNILPYVMAAKGMKEGPTGTKTVAPFEKSFVPEAAEAFKQEGVKPPISAVTKSPFLQSSESVMSKSVFGREITETMEQAKIAITEKAADVADNIKNSTTFENLQGKTDKIVNELKPKKSMSEENLGKDIQQGLSEYEKTFKQTEEKVYSDFRKKFGKSDAIIKSTENIVSDVVNEQSKDLFRGVDPRVRSMLDRITGDNLEVVREARSQGQPEAVIEQIKAKYRPKLDFDTLKATRTAVGEALAKDTENGGLKRIYGALSQDMQSTVQAVDQPSGMVLDVINKQYATGRAKIESALAQSIEKSNPERIAQNLVSRNSADTMILLKEILGPEKFNEVSKAFLRDMFDDAVTGGKFDVTKLRKNFSGYDKSTIEQLMSPDQIKQFQEAVPELQKLDKLQKIKTTVDNAFNKKEQFDLAKFKKELRKYNLDEAFTAEEKQAFNEQVAELEKYQKMQGYLKPGEKYTQGSQTAYLANVSRVGVQVYSIITQALSGNLKTSAALLGELGFEYGSSKLFTSDFGRSLMTSGFKFNYPRVLPVQSQQDKTPVSTPASILPFKKKK